jgi:hypothetical protein
VKPAANQGNRLEADPALSHRSQRTAGYHKVFDGRKRPIRALWKRKNPPEKELEHFQRRPGAFVAPSLSRAFV